MKRLVEEENAGMIGLLEKNITIFTSGYFYSGKLIGVNDTCVELGNPSIVYETGEFSDSSYKVKQSLNVDNCYISNNAIESFWQSDK